MNAPICPIHNCQMRASKYGSGFYCPNKIAGAWCDGEADTAKLPAQIEAQHVAEDAAAQVVMAALAAMGYDAAQANKAAAIIFDGRMEEWIEIGKIKTAPEKAARLIAIERQYGRSI